MVKIIKPIAIFTMGLAFCLASILTVEAKKITIPLQNATTSVDANRDSVARAVVKEEVTNTGNTRESFFPGKTKSLAFSHFTWGAEAGASVDMTSHDLSTFDVDVLLGFKNKFIKLAGIGGGIHHSIYSGNNFIPVYAVLRTSFRSKPSLLFLNLQAGYSFNTVKHSGTVGDFCSAIGVGINLQQSNIAKSYIILSCAYQNFSEASRVKTDIDTRDIFYAKLVIGVNF